MTTIDRLAERDARYHLAVSLHAPNDTLRNQLVPVNKNIRIQTVASDVIHAFAVPSFGIKIDAIPGRINETWFRAERVGTFYGQCSELCGMNHAFMPIEIRVVSRDDFNRWVGHDEAFDRK